MATSTDVPIYTTTLSTAAASVTIPLTDYQQYKNLKIVATANHDGTGSGVNQWRMQFNGDSTSGLYSDINIYGNGSTAGSNRDSNQNFIYCGLVGQTSMTYSPVSRFHIMNYSNSSMHKTVLVRGDAAGQAVYQTAGLWRNTSAVTSVTLFMTGQNLKAGSTISVYGIGSATASIKATGGAIYSDADYMYHVFTSTGAFTPTQSLTADILAVAGGGGGWAGAGGAGGHVYSTSTSLASGTAYTCTVGAGGPQQTTGGQGGNSNVTGGALSLTAAVGGGYGGGGSGMAGGNGGSGGGGGWGYGAGGSGTAGQGYAGGAGSSGGGGAGGGATSAGDSGPNGYRAGTGTNAYSNFVKAIGAGELYNGEYYFSGGGGYSANNVPVGGGNGGVGGGGGHLTGIAKGMPNTGGGGNGDNAGGSGIVIVRYVR